MSGPLNGRDLGIARQRLRQLVRPDVTAPTVTERVEVALTWFVNGDGVAYPSLKTLHARVAEDAGGEGLHIITIARHVTRLPHFVTAGYFARLDNSVDSGALRGGAIRVVHPDVAGDAGFPPLMDALKRLEMYRKVLFREEFLQAFWANSDDRPRTV